MGERRFGRRGNAAVTALSLGALLGFGALAVDVAYVRVVTTQLQIAVEAGALAGVAYLDGSQEGVLQALDQAAHVAGLNTIYGGQLIGPGAFEAGRYTPEAGFVPASDPGEVNAIRADASYTGFGSLLAGVAFGQNTLGTRADALAMRDVGGTATQVECFLPFVLPDCLFDPSAPPEEQFFEVGPHVSNNLMAWAHPDGANMGSGKSVRGYFQTPGSNCSAIAVGDAMPVMNGVGSANKEVKKTLNGEGNGLAPTPWPEDLLGPPPARDGEYAFEPGNGNGHSAVKEQNWGNTVSGPLALVDACDQDGNPVKNWTGSKTITGFTWAVLYDANNHNGQPAFKVRVDFNNEHALGSGAGSDATGNVISKNSPPILVY